MSIKLDWEVSDAPHDDNPAAEARSRGLQPPGPSPTPPPNPANKTVAVPSGAPPAAGRARIARLWPALLLAALIAAGGASLWMMTRSGWQRMSADIEALVRYEDEAAQQGQADLVLNVQDTGNRDWLEVRQAELRRQAPAPLPAPMLSSAHTSPEVASIDPIDANFVAAAVRRTFSTSSGQALTFVLPQIYQRDGRDDWQRTAPPGNFWGAWEDWRTGYLHVRHSARDSAFVTAVAPRIERWLRQACELWAAQCTGVLPAKLYLSGYVGSLEYDPLGNVEVRVEFEQGSNRLPADYFLSIPSPQIAGIPVDAAGEDYLAKYLTVRLIASLATRGAGTQSEADQLTAHAIKVLNLGGADPGFTARAPHWEPTVAGADGSGAAARTIVVDAAGDPPQTLAWVTYVIQPGDTLVAVATRFDVSLEAIIQWNDLPDPDLIVAGATLQIPIDPARSERPGTRVPAPPSPTPSP